MDESHQDTNLQLDAITGKLATLLDQLAERREKCTTRAEKKHLDRLRRDAKKQVSAMIKLQQSVDHANAIIAKSSQALEKPQADKRPPRQSEASEVNSMLFRAVAGPFQNQHRLRLVRQRRSPELSQFLKPWKPSKSATTASMTKRKPGPTTTLKQSASTNSDDSGRIDVQSARPATEAPPEIEARPESDARLEIEVRPETEAHPETEVCPAAGISQEGNTPNLAPSQEVSTSKLNSDSDADSDSDSDQDPQSGSALSLCSSSSSSLDFPSQDQDGSADHSTQPPPLPRKSSRRISRIPRVPSSSQMPPLPPLPLAPLPLMPRAVPKSSSSSPSSSSAASTTDKLAEDLLSSLEKRYSLTMTRTVSTTSSIPSTL
ncbi:hypothetical protein G647_08440 [Cladophialophora carrionii CBS 160.54]|uniref:Uncharacterized protein n=1 Tax=Cladophialophora carrionii CBS 160.54 TaxID=1279043 RepID=V9D0K3_9EURO|nr:uncharacterized protein G647_08440 [Cladophialophora carrionii CBS 160.54]ETI20405.1 hypothetical protein G647_08440 [Cladophialophora carrionii CBS 160.54]